MEPDHSYAGPKLRAAAMGLDLFMIFAYIAVLLAVTITFVWGAGYRQLVNTPLKQDFVAFATLILPVILVSSYFESSARQGTIGKQKAGIMVTDTGGGRLSFGRAFMRSGLKFLPWQLAHTAVIQLLAGNESAIMLALSILAQVLLIFYWVSLLVSKQRRTPYDWLAGTVVIKTTPSVQAHVTAGQKR